jgi:hypothetical protein
LIEPEDPDSLPVDKKIALGLIRLLLGQMPFRLLECIEETRNQLARYGYSDREISDLINITLEEARDMYDFSREELRRRNKGRR